jgi:phosphohistidine swiveling domain-containing protein
MKLKKWQSSWLWEDRFLDEEKLKKRYELFIEAHARMDNGLSEGKLDKEIQKNLDILRNKMHLWAYLFGNILKKDIQMVTVDIISKRDELRGMSEISCEGQNSYLFLLKVENGLVTVEINYPGERIYNHMNGLEYANDSYLSAIIKALVKFNRDKIINFSKKEREEQIGPEYRGHYKVFCTDYLKFPYPFLPIFIKQFRFLIDYWNENFNYDFVSRIHPYLDEPEEIAQLCIALASADFRSDTANPSDIKLKIVGNKGYRLSVMEKISSSLIPPFIIEFENILQLDKDGLRKTISNSFDELLGVRYVKLLPPSGYIKHLLLTVRSNPLISMPGLMDTILNIGLTYDGVWLLAEKYGARFAYETYARFLRSFGTGVFGIDKEEFGNIPDDLSDQTAKELAKRYEKIIKKYGYKVPQDPYKQLEMAIKAVEDSWDSEQAKKYRKENGIPDDLGMAVIIQEMKFGNLNENSGSFVLFTRDPITGEKGLFIEYAPQRQGEDLVSGSINPVPIEESGLSEKVINEIKEYAEKIEKEFKYAQDIEGVIEDGKVWILQTRDAKLSPEAEIKALVDMVEEGILTKEEALMRINLEELEDRLSHMQIAPETEANPIAKGLGASSGAVGGVIAFDLEDIEKYKNQNLPVILVKKEFYPYVHLEELMFSDGLVTQIGGRLSHGAIQGRIHEKPTIVGANIEVDRENKTVTIGGKLCKAGDYITIDGTNGNVYDGKIELIKPEEVNPYLEILKEWYQEVYGEK